MMSIYRESVMFSAPYSLFIKFDICNPYKSAASTAYVLFFCAKFTLIIGGFLHFRPSNPLTQLLLSVAMAMRMYRSLKFALRASYITKCPQF